MKVMNPDRRRDRRSWIPALGRNVHGLEVVDVDDLLAESLVAQGWVVPGDSPDDDTVSGWLSWVDGDPERAEHALNRESARSRPRQSLLDAIAEILTPTTEADQAAQEA